MHDLRSHASVFVRPQGCEPGDVYFMQTHTHTYTEQKRSSCLALGNTQQENYFYEDFSSVTKVRKEGREGREGGRGQGARQRGDELSEAERVVQLRLVPTEAGEAGQLWKPGGGALQVSGRSSPPSLQLPIMQLFCLFRQKSLFHLR